MGLYDRGYYREGAARQNRWDADQSRTFVLTLVVVNAAVFLIDQFTPVTKNGSHQLSEWMCLRADTWREPWNWWRFLTYGFAHSPLDSRYGVMHLLGNMLTLFFLGRPVEMVLGSARFLRMYLAAIVVAGIGWTLVAQLKGQTAGVMGASGAVSAVIAVFIMRFFHERLLLFGVVPVRAWLLGVIIIVSDLFNSFSPTSRVAGEAHLFGAAFGAAFSYWNWNLGWLDASWLRSWIQAGPRLRVHNPGGRKATLQEQADRILDKISREGESSLSRHERQTLEEYSRQVRERRGD